MTADERERLEQELRRLRAALEERRANIPAHTVRPHQILALEDLEERIAQICQQLGAES